VPTRVRDPDIGADAQPGNALSPCGGDQEQEEEQEADSDDGSDMGIA